jgi:hypothetical protein
MNQLTSGSLHSACSALIRVCDVCGKVNAIDLDSSPEAERDMQEIDHTVKLVTQEEAMEAWKDAGRCDHKGLVESLRAQLAAPNAGLRSEGERTS